MFGSVAAGLNDNGSDLDVACFYPNFANVPAQEREMCLHMVFGFLSQHILHTCPAVRLLWSKYTIAFEFHGTAIDLSVSWTKTGLHSHVELSRCLRERAGQTVSAWRRLLESARQSGIAQQRGDARGSRLKTAVVSLLLAAALQLEPDSGSRNGISVGDGLVQLAVCLSSFLARLREEFKYISMTYDEGRKDIDFHLQPKNAPDTEDQRARLVLMNELDMDSWHSRNCVHSGCAVGIPEMRRWLSTLIPSSHRWLERAMD